jgi:hypothetical protein
VSKRIDEALESQLRHWLDQHGYPLEMRTAQALSEAQFLVMQGVSYTDPTTGAKREIDLQAFRFLELNIEDRKRIIGIHLRLVIECKSTKGRPWMAFAAHPHPFEFDYYPFFLSRGSKHFLDFALILQRNVPELPQLPLPNPGMFPEAYAVAVAFRPPNDNDLAHAAVKAVTAAVQSLDKEEDIDMVGYGVLTLNDQIPLVVIDQPLFLASLMSDGSLEIREADAVVARVSDTSRDRAFIVTESFLPRFLEKLNNDFEAFEASFKSPASETKNLFWAEVISKLVQDPEQNSSN